MDSVKDSQESSWEQLEIPGLFEQLPNPPNDAEESDETKNNEESHHCN
jgi:hypothetical protein